MSIPCPVCGHVESDAANFCSACGHDLDLVAADEATPTMQTPVVEDTTGETVLGSPNLDDALLVVTRGPNAGSRYILEPGETSVGRHPDSDIFLDDVTVSRAHAVVTGGAGAWRITDAGSLNGTYVNGSRVDESALANGDEVQIGRFKLVFFPGRPG